MVIVILYRVLYCNKSVINGVLIQVKQLNHLMFAAKRKYRVYNIRHTHTFKNQYIKKQLVDIAIVD